MFSRLPTFLTRAALIAAIAAVPTLGLPGCEKDSGDKIEEGVEDLGEDIEEAADDAGREIEDAVD